ncbi:MAG: FAD-dependent oxidoreductase, partial [Parabacteroides sp.]|nr:FAD-dependent oxidoreductase [Parabacteroides sp.]
MNNNELNERLELLEKAGMDRRHFLKLMGMTGMLTVAGTSQIKAFSSNAKGKIVIIGGGAAGLSMAARLMNWLDEPDVTLIDPSELQYYQPGFTLIASGVYKPEDVYKKQEACIPSGVKWIKDSVAAVDPVKNEIRTQTNGVVAYDFLVLTPGLQINWNLVEGMTQETLGQGNAHCIYDFEGAKRTWAALQEFGKKGGRGIFTDTYTKHKCGGAPKKICLLTEHYTRKQNTRDKVKLDYFTAAHELYDVKYYTTRLEEIYKERNVSITL